MIRNIRYIIAALPMWENKEYNGSVATRCIIYVPRCILYIPQYVQICQLFEKLLGGGGGQIHDCRPTVGHVVVMPQGEVS
jgi:hypothetical protein